MFTPNSDRQRTQTQSFSQPQPYRSQDYYLPPDSAHRPFVPDTNATRADLYPNNDGDIYSGGTRYAHSREYLPPVANFNQSHDRRSTTSSSDFRGSPSASYHDQGYVDSRRSDLSNMSQINRGDVPNVVDNFSISNPRTTFNPPTSAVAGPSSEHSGDSDFWPNNLTEVTQVDPPKPRKSRREKPRIELAPDQPPTTQGKPRARVYVACLQCRTRKIRCDGAKPVCHNCGRRTNGNNECSYDPIPKRRGPDKTPGARQRMARDVRNEVDNGSSTRRRRRARDNPNSTNQTPHQEHPTRQSSIPGSSPSRNHASDNSISLSLSPGSPACIHPTSDFVPFSAYSRPYSLCGCHGLMQCPGLQRVVRNISDTRKPAVIATYRGQFDPATVVPTYSQSSNRGYIIELANNGNEETDVHTPDIGSEPSLNFSRKIWWDSLLSLYFAPTSPQLQALTVSQRQSAARGITSDLRFLFRESNYWFSFFHIPSFFGNFFDPGRRERIQPSLVLALLAMATFWQSSEVGYGKQGRERALRFRDEAQAAMDASFNAGWIDETLAQAAWLLALFEVSSHPRHSSERSTSSMVMLDSIIRSLSLTLMDADDPSTSMFSPGTVPIVNSPKPRTAWFPAQSPPISPDVQYGADGHVASLPTQSHTVTDSGCNCNRFTLGEHWPSANEYAPMWSATPAWDDTWSEGDIRKESCRRLCWSSMILAAGHISYTTAQRSEGLDLFIADPANYALLFSGESVARSPALSNYSSKDTIWALHDRSFLLWHGCIRMRSSNVATKNDKAQFAVKAWLEADSLEQALNRHACAIERAFIYQAREYIFNTRMCISYEFQRYVPLATANVNGLFHRNKAEEWLTHQAIVAERYMHGLHTVTGNSNNLLARRPFFVFWFMGQIHRAISLWECDNTLSVALDVCKALIPAIDYLTALWPCLEQRRRYESLREKLAGSCFIAGVKPPPPPDLTLPLLSSPETLV